MPEVVFDAQRNGPSRHGALCNAVLRAVRIAVEVAVEIAARIVATSAMSNAAERIASAQPQAASEWCEPLFVLTCGAFPTGRHVNLHFFFVPDLVFSISLQAEPDRLRIL